MATAEDMRGSPWPGEFEARMTVEVGEGGEVVGAVADRTVPPVVADLLQKRAREWRFEAPTYQGRPARINALLRARLQLVPTTAGGHAVRIVRVEPGDMFSAVGAMRFNRVARSATLVYVARVGTDGRLADVELVLPREVPRAVGTLDMYMRSSLRQMPPFQRTLNGQPLACHLVRYISIGFNGEPAPDLSADSDAVANALPDKCPATRLLSEVAGTTL